MSRERSDAVRRVLVFGDDTRSFLAVVRSLARRGIGVDACPFEWGGPALRSRYIERAVRIAPYTLGADEWNAALVELLTTRRYDLLIPCDERSIIPLLQFAMPPTLNTKVALPPRASFDTFFDKLLTRRAAAAAGVPIAAGRELADADTAEALADRYGLPLVLKPRRSYALDNPNARATVQVCATLAELGQALDGLRSRADAYVEQFFAGEGVGVSILACEGQVLQSFEHRRLHESSSAGGSSFRESVALSDDLLRHVRSLALATRWTGVAMFEFRRDPASGNAVLLEVNGRFWGSLPLAVASGVDFPFLLYRLLVDGVEEPQQLYRVGQRARSVTSDFYATLRRFEAARARGLGVAATSLVRSATGWMGFVRGNESQDSVAIDDPRPGIAEYQGLGLTMAQAALRRAPGMRALRRRRAHAAVERCARLSGERDILILCQGNICRSPFAEHLLRVALPPQSPLRVRSAGMLALNGRSAEPLAVQCATAYGVDLSNHRSCYATDAMLMAAALIVVFDARNRLALRQRGLSLSAPVIGLAEMGDSGEAQIADPYGHPVEFFQRTYQQIALGVDALASGLLGRTQARR